MSDTGHGGALGVDARWPGGEPDPVTAGTDPPPVPSDAPGLVRRFVSDDPDQRRHTALRVALEEPSEQRARSLVAELRSEMNVLGTTHGDAARPEDAPWFTVVVAMDYDAATAATALADPPEVAGVTAVDVLVVPEPGGRDDRGEDGGAAGDGTPAADETPAGDRAGAGDDDVAAAMGETTRDADDEPGGSDAAPGNQEEGSSPSTGDGSAASGATIAGTDGDGESIAPTEAAAGDGREAAGGQADDDHETANHPAFEELKSDIEPVSYDSLVEELESTTLPGEFRDTADLEPVLEADDGVGDDAEDGPDEGTGTGDGATSGVDGDVEVPQLHDGGGAPTEGAAIHPETVVEALVAAAEADALTDDQVRTLSEALDGGTKKTMKVRLDHLQREVDELSAYKDTLETFIEEYGAGDEFIEQVRGAMQTFSSDVERIGTTIDALQDDMERTDARLQELDGSVVDTAETVEDLQAEMTTTDDFEGLADDVDRLADDVAAADAALSATDERVDALEGAVEAFGGRLGDVERTLQGVEETLEGVEGTLADVDGRLDEFDGHLADVDGRLDEFDGHLADVDGRLDEFGGRLADVDGRVEDHEHRFDEVDDLADRVEAVGELEEQLAELADDVAALRAEVSESGGADATVGQRLAGVEESLGQLDARMSAMETENRQGLEAVNERLDTVEQRLDEQEAWQEKVQSLVSGSVSLEDTSGK